MKNLDLISVHTKLPSIEESGLEFKAKVTVKRHSDKRLSTQPTQNKTNRSSSTSYRYKTQYFNIKKEEAQTNYFTQANFITDMCNSSKPVQSKTQTKSDRDSPQSQFKNSEEVKSQTPLTHRQQYSRQKGSPFNIQWVLFKDNKDVNSFQAEKKQEPEQDEEILQKLYLESIQRYIRSKPFSLTKTDTSLKDTMRIEAPSLSTLEGENYNTILRENYVIPRQLKLAKNKLQRSSSSKVLIELTQSNVIKDNADIKKSLLSQIYNEQEGAKYQIAGKEASSLMTRSLSQSFLLKTLDSSKQENKKLIEYNKFKFNQQGPKVNPFSCNVQHILLKKLTRSQYFDYQCLKLLKDKMQDQSAIDHNETQTQKQVVHDDMVRLGIQEQLTRVIAQVNASQIRPDGHNHGHGHGQTSGLGETNGFSQSKVIQNPDITIFKEGQNDNEDDEESLEIIPRPDDINSKSMHSNKFFKEFLSSHEKNYVQTMQKMKKNGTSAQFQKSLRDYLDAQQCISPCTQTLRRSRALLEPLKNPKSSLQTQLTFLQHQQTTRTDFHSRRVSSQINDDIN
ncbi:UNKNOWN [Stylonychia lemnae]|uniref:Uncharacterized protein n=1 Tax=Stylonychia lemnae TaxID=5949 RepID=A0A078B9T9_STYLE|nr:UNKNOWN [Stylonychia lemnae]|eukprot:CDW91285.1 UNKNOWN [Stylonychia lemnae]